MPDLVLAPSGEPVSGSGSKKQYQQPQPPHRLRSNLQQLHLPRLHRRHRWYHRQRRHLVRLPRSSDPARLRRRRTLRQLSLTARALPSTTSMSCPTVCHSHLAELHKPCLPSSGPVHPLGHSLRSHRQPQSSVLVVTLLLDRCIRTAATRQHSRLLACRWQMDSQLRFLTPRLTLPCLEWAAPPPRSAGFPQRTATPRRIWLKCAR